MCGITSRLGFTSSFVYELAIGRVETEFRMKSKPKSEPLHKLPMNIEFADFLDRLRSLEEACAEHEARLRMLERERPTLGDLYANIEDDDE